MATLSPLPIIEYGVAFYALPGESVSGDRHLVRHRSNTVLLASIDGLGHGNEAAAAADTALATLQDSTEDSLVALMQQCHERLRNTRGVVMTLASIDFAQGMLTWLGVGNVQGLLLRRLPSGLCASEELLLRAGVVGAQLPPLQASSSPIVKGDTLIFVTDGIRPEFAEDLAAPEPPQKLADKILSLHCRGNDDALVLVTRYLENQR